MKTLTHNLIKEKADTKKVLYYKGKYYNHLLIFSANIEHAQVIKKLMKHFKLNDKNAKSGLLIEDKKIIFYGEFTEMYNLKEDKNLIYEL
jgi:RNA binding exosome subunit